MSSERINEHNHTVLFGLVTAAVIAVLVTSIPMASAASIPWSGGDGGNAWDLTEFSISVRQIYELLSNISIYFGIIGMTYSAYVYMVSSENDAATALKNMKRILVTVCAINVLPLVVRLGYDIFQKYKWDPSNPMN